LFWPDVVETMSLSRIIKCDQLVDSNVGAFVFQPFNRPIPDQPAGEPSAGFVPMGIFDTSEVKGASADHPEELQVHDKPAGVTLTEEELHQRLSESFEQGLIEGKNLAERGLVNVFRSLRAATEGVQALHEKVMRECEDDLIDLVMMMARKVILREVSLERGILADVVQAAIAALSERCEITIRLNPDDYALVANGPDDSFRRELLTERMRLKADPLVLQGGCQIDSEMGTVDAGIDGQLDEIFRRFLEQRTLSIDNDE